LRKQSREVVVDGAPGADYYLSVQDVFVDVAVFKRSELDALLRKNTDDLSSKR